MTRIIGLTGGIGTGKSTVSNFLRQRGVDVVDADLVAHQSAAKGRWGYRRIVRAFGKDILDATGSINRERLREVAFENDNTRRRLNRATHLPIAMEVRVTPEPPRQQGGACGGWFNARCLRSEYSRERPPHGA